MESIFKKVDKLLAEYPNADIDDLMVELEEKELTLDERLEEIGYTRTEALAAARAEPQRRAKIARDLGIENLKFPYFWAELSKNCLKISTEKLELILWLMSGGTLTVNEKLSDDELIGNWLHSFKRYNENMNFLNCYVKAFDQYTNIEIELANSKLRSPEDKINESESELVLSMLCNNGYADDCENKKILLGNLQTISGIIGELSFLEPVKPLIYYQIVVRYRKKLFGKRDFVPNRKKILEPYEYDYSSDNGKNFNQYYTYCRLYSDMKKLFPKANTELCDMGFSLCSNLANWWYKICAEEDYKSELDLDMPFTLDMFVPEQFVSCFEESEIGKTMSVSSGKLIKWRKSNVTFCNNAQKAVRNIDFVNIT